MPESIQSSEPASARLQRYKEMAEKVTEEFGSPWEINQDAMEVWCPATGYYLGVEADNMQDPVALFVAMCPEALPDAVNIAEEAIRLLEEVRMHEYIENGLLDKIKAFLAK